METKWLTPSEMAAWRTYIETYADLNAAIERDLGGHRLTMGDYQVLVYLSEADDTVVAHVRPRRLDCSCRRAG